MDKNNRVKSGWPQFPDHPSSLVPLGNY